MAHFTIELRNLLEAYTGMTEPSTYSEMDKLIYEGRKLLFDFSYPIFDESYRETIETKIIRHFYFREIGQETPGRFKSRLYTKMNEIMPYYNQLYRSEKLTYDPFIDTDIATTFNRNADEIGENNRNNSGSTNTDTTNTGERTTDNTVSTETESTDNSTNTTNATTTGKRRHSDTPQGGLTGLENDQYMSDATLTDETVAQSDTGEQTSNVGMETTGNEETHSTDTGNAKTETTFGEVATHKINNTEDTFNYTKGKSGGRTYMEMLKEYRESFLNIDLMVINQLEPLFMGLWE